MELQGYFYDRIGKINFRPEQLNIFATKSVNYFCKTIMDTSPIHGTTVSGFVTYAFVHIDRTCVHNTNVSSFVKNEITVSNCDCYK